MQNGQLVGRPLVPYFDANDSLNESLRVDCLSFEEIDVDARVWNQSIGYFEYPTEKPNEPSKDANSRQDNSRKASKPIAIHVRETRETSENQPNAEPSILSTSFDGMGNTKKKLLTPEMLSSSAPSDSSMIHHLQIQHEKNQGDSDDPRGRSRKRSSKIKKCLETSLSRKEKDKPTMNTSSINKSTGDKNENSSTKKSIKSSKKEELSALGKWAWSAFQSSPDPKHLPLPPFLVISATNSPVIGVTNKSDNRVRPSPLRILQRNSSPTEIAEKIDFAKETSLLKQPSLPNAPPSNGQLDSLGSIEASMTQDLRRMLNIGG